MVNNKVMESEKHKFNVGIFVTCLVNMFRPEVGFATIELCEKANCHIIVPEEQTCCGQVNYNNGDEASAKKAAQSFIDMFEEFDYIVIPSGSCRGMVYKHYPTLLADDMIYHEKAQKIAEKTYELTQFLHDVMNIRLDKIYDGDEKVTYHSSCSSLRECHIKDQPANLLKQTGMRYIPLDKNEECCGFGGSFCVKYPDISDRMVSDKVKHINDTKADYICAGDLGCLLNIAGKLSFDDQKHTNNAQKHIETRHIAEILAGKLDSPAIAQGEDEFKGI